MTVILPVYDLLKLSSVRNQLNLPVGLFISIFIVHRLRLFLRLLILPLMSENL